MKNKRTFIDRLTGVSRVDNAANPASAYSMKQRQKPAPAIKQGDQMRRHIERMFKTSSTFGKGWGP